MASSGEQVCPPDGISMCLRLQSTKFGEQQRDHTNMCRFTSRQVPFEFPRDLLREVPYLETILSGRFPHVEGEDGLWQLDLNPGVLRPILDYVQTGQARFLFTHLSCEESAEELFTFLDFLCVKLHVVDGFSLDHGNTEIIECFMAAIAANDNNCAQDIAVIFAQRMHFEMYDFESHIVRNNIFIGMEFIFSHPSTFQGWTRAHVMEVWTHKVSWRMTNKQVKIIEGQAMKLSSSEGENKSDNDLSSTMKLSSSEGENKSNNDLSSIMKLSSSEGENKSDNDLSSTQASTMKMDKPTPYVMSAKDLYQGFKKLEEEKYSYQSSYQSFKEWEEAGWEEAGAENLPQPKPTKLDLYRKFKKWEETRREYERLGHIWYTLSTTTKPDHTQLEEARVEFMRILGVWDPRTFEFVRMLGIKDPQSVHFVRNLGVWDGTVDGSSTGTHDPHHCIHYYGFW